MPYQTPFIFKYDCGEFERNLDRALELSGYAGFPARREEARRRGKLRGIGIASPIEVAGGPYRKPAPTGRWSSAHDDGSVTVVVGNMSVGQGLETTFSSLVAQRLGVPADKVKYVQGDTDAIADGKGNGGSAALTIGGSATHLGVDDLLDKARAIAARELEVSLRGPGLCRRRIPRARLGHRDHAGAAGAAVQARAEKAAAAAWPAPRCSRPRAAPSRTAATCARSRSTPTPGVAGRRLHERGGRGPGAQPDAGRRPDPWRRGAGHRPGAAGGDPLRRFGPAVTGSFMDYAMPRASDLPRVVGDNPETPTAMNPLGVKGVGEAGTVGGLAATMNAVCNALQPAGIRHLDMPATPQRVWQALQQAGWYAR
jgi:carbon-monoxide dehydrogenase large subunit